jgi:hypothetical protein
MAVLFEGKEIPVQRRVNKPRDLSAGFAGLHVSVFRRYRIRAQCLLRHKTGNRFCRLAGISL